jgi:hypothetical protein
VNQLINGFVPQLHFDTSGLNPEQKRLLASLKVRMGFTVAYIGKIALLHEQKSSSEARKFLRAFEEAAKKSDKSTALIACNQLCKVKVPNVVSLESNIDAARLLLSIRDDDASDKQYSNIVVLCDQTISVSVMELLSIDDPNYGVYSKGRELFANCLEQSDLLCSTPLEAAYNWTISCRSAIDGKIYFCMHDTVNIRCNGLVAGQLFHDTNNSEYALDFLKKGTMYYTIERNGNDNNDKYIHPIADLFFLSDKDELVLVSIIGGGSETAFEKVKQLTTWIQKEKNNISKYKLRGVVLAHNVHETSKHNSETGVSIVCVEEAMSLLGGLAQISNWLE